MNRSLRYIVVFFAFAASYIFTYWIPLSFIPGILDLPLLHNILALILATGVGILAWKNTTDKHNLISRIFMGGVITGTISFLLGFVGPMIFYPSPQGPLLGILITGPLGLILGMIGGAVYHFIKKRKAARPA